MKKLLFVENIKCGGCAKSIKDKLSTIVKDVKVDEINGNISFNYRVEDQIEQVLSALERMGYPEIGKSNFAHKAKSYVSCMVGKVKK